MKNWLERERVSESCLFLAADIYVLRAALWYIYNMLLLCAVCCSPCECSQVEYMSTIAPAGVLFLLNVGWGRLYRAPVLDATQQQHVLLLLEGPRLPTLFCCLHTKLYYASLSSLYSDWLVKLRVYIRTRWEREKHEPRLLNRMHRSKKLASGPGYIE